MLSGQKVLAIVPARGGSKRLPGKNIKPLHGKPLINWTVDAALECNLIDRVIVSSDSEEILQISSLPGVTTHKRAQSLADDTTSSVAVALDVLSRFTGFDVIVWLQPTSPLRTSSHISQALELYDSMAATSVVSLCPVKYSPQIINSLDANKQLSNFYSPGLAAQRSQDIKPAYQLNGAIYIISHKELIKQKRFLLPDSNAYIMEPEVSVDIDNELDFMFAEFLSKILVDRPSC